MTAWEHATSFVLQQSPLTSLYELTVITAVLLLQRCSIVSYSTECLCAIIGNAHLPPLFKGHTLILGINHMQSVQSHKYFSFLVQTSCHQTLYSSVAKAYIAQYQQLSTLAIQLSSTWEASGQIKLLTCNVPALANTFCREIHFPPVTLLHPSGTRCSL